MPNNHGSLRFERKFVVEGPTLPEVVGAVRQNVALFFEEYPARKVNNIYFDTADLRNYRQNIDGHSERAKVRIRWYGDLLGLVRRPVLEVKRKQGLLGTKDAAPLPPFDMNPGFGGVHAIAVVRAAPLSLALRREVETVEPALMNRYHRLYFRSADRRLRLTLDSGLEFYHMARHHNTFLRHARVRPIVVLELKYADDAHLDAARAVNSLPFRLGRMSKYVLGIEMLRG